MRQRLHILEPLRSVKRILVVLFLIHGACYLSHATNDAAPDAGSDAVDCTGMDARGLPSCTVGVETYFWWDGGTCVASVCVCSGTDCVRTFSSRAECEAAFSRCR